MRDQEFLSAVGPVHSGYRAYQNPEFGEGYYEEQPPASRAVAQNARFAWRPAEGSVRMWASLDAYARDQSEEPEATREDQSEEPEATREDTESGLYQF